MKDNLFQLHACTFLSYFGLPYVGTGVVEHAAAQARSVTQMF